MTVYVPPRPMTAKASFGGIAGAWLGQGNPMMTSLSNSPQKIMATAQVLYRQNVHIRSAERVVDNRFSTVPWHLEDANDDEVTDESAPNLLAIKNLIERPYTPRPGDPLTMTPKTRAGLWSLTCRHIGLCGMSHWYLDQTEALGGTPLEVLYINPARMTAAEDKQGNRTGWVMDADARGGGVPFTNDEIITFYLEPPDSGHYGTGLVETVYAKANLMRLLDQHVSGVMAAGGRLSGIISPKAGETLPDEQFKQLLLDIRTIAEAPDAAKRMLVLMGPVDFAMTSGSLSELQTIDLEVLAREDILEVWGVPQSQLGIPSPSGLNSGAKQGFDEAVLWQNGVGPRLRTFVETVQYELLDKYKTLGTVIELEVDEPTFDDRLPQFDLADKATNQPLKTIERRDLLGLPPFGDERDEQVIMPIQFRVLDIGVLAPPPVPFGGAPGGGPVIPGAPPVLPSKPPLRPENSTNALSPGKAKMDRLRETLAASMEKDVAKVLSEMGAAIAATARSGHFHRKPKDELFSESRWERALAQALAPHVAAITEAGFARVTTDLGPAKAGLSDTLLSKLLGNVGLRIKGITEYTRQRLTDIVKTGIEQGMSPAELGTLIADSAIFDKARAEMIARTETGTALNLSTIGAYREYGVEKVLVYDGDADDICQPWDGRIVTLDEAEGEPLGHPNCTRDWSPIVGKAAPVPQVWNLNVNVEPGPVPVVNVTTSPTPAPIVNVTTPDVTVNVPTPVVNVTTTEGKAQLVQDIRIIEMPGASRKVKRDRYGQITEINDQ